ncbi:MAG: hypothetical protein Q9165_007223 [Trypethelium subeluteriae]
MAHIYNSQLDAFALYHKVREEEEESAAESQSTLSSLTPALPALGEALSGATGTALSHLLIYPLDLVITRLQVQQRQRQQQQTTTENGRPINAGKRQYYANIFDAFRRIYEDEGGIGAFYTGVVEDTAKSIADSFLFFLAYTLIRRTRQRQRKGALPIVDELLVGMAAGAFSKLLTTPVQNIVTRKQTAALETQDSLSPTENQSNENPEAQPAKPIVSSHPPHHSTPSTTAIAQRIRAEKGILGFWSGYSASLLLTLNPSLTFLLHSLLSRLLLRTRRHAPTSTSTTNKNPALSPRLTFLVAALSKAIASTCTYPIGLAKARAQAGGVAAAAATTMAVGQPGEKQAPRFQAPYASYEGWHERSEYRRGAGAGAGAGLRVPVPAVLVPRVLRTVVRIARVEGVAAVYAGLGGEVVKGFLGHGLTMLLKQRVHVGVVALWGLVVRLFGVLRREGRVG